MLPLPNQVPKPNLGINLDSSSFLSPYVESMSKSYDFISLRYLISWVSLSLSPYIRPLASLAWVTALMMLNNDQKLKKAPCLRSMALVENGARGPLEHDAIILASLVF